MKEIAPKTSVVIVFLAKPSGIFSTASFRQPTNSIMRSPLVALTALVLVLSANLASAQPPVRAEIDSLLDKLQSSACEFYRNGSWHTSSEAKSHLLRKLEYLEEKNAVQSTEQFIELGASNSSFSGKPYLVKCGNGTPIESRSWLSTELMAIRASVKVQTSGPK